MKKINVILVVLFLICAVATLSFAQTATQIAQVTSAKKAEVSAEVIRGKVTSIDTAKNEITVKENKSDTEKTIAVTSKVLSSLKTNDEVQVIVKAGSNVAESVKKIVKKVATIKKSSKK
jgi:hypothetical protein